MLFSTTDQSPSGKARRVSLSRVILLLVLIGGNMFFGVQYFKARNESSVMNVAADNQVLNKKMLAFANLFIEKVLKAKGEIDFETRLQLENAVRDLKDQDILN